MIQIGDEVTIQWYPWSSHPITITYEIISNKSFWKMGHVEKMLYICPDNTLFKLINLRQDPGYLFEKRNKKGLLQIHHFTILNIKKMSEVKTPMKTKELKKFLNEGKKLMFKLPDYRGGTHTWVIFPKNENEKGEKKYRLMVNGKYWDEIETWKVDNIYTKDKMKDWTNEAKLIDADRRSLMEMDTPFIDYNNTLGKYLINESVVKEQLPKKIKSKKQFRRIERNNLNKLKKITKKIHHAHQRNCITVPETKHVEVIKNHDKHENKLKIYRIICEYNRVHFNVTARTTEQAYNKAVLRGYGDVKVAYIVKVLIGGKSSLKKAYKPIKTDDSQLHAHLRMVCIKHDETGDIQRLKYYQAEKIVKSEEREWNFCGKWEYKRFISTQHAILKGNRKDGIQPGSTFARSKGLKGKPKNVIGHRNEKLQLIKKSILGKDQITKKKIIILKVPIYRYVITPITKSDKSLHWIDEGRLRINDNLKGFPAGTIFGNRVIKYCVGYEDVKQEIEYVPIKKYTYKTIKVYNPKVRKQVKLTVQERADIKDKKEKIQLERNKQRKIRNAYRLEHKLYKKSPHLTSKDKIKLGRMSRTKKQ